MRVKGAGERPREYKMMPEHGKVEDANIFSKEGRCVTSKKQIRFRGRAAERPARPPSKIRRNFPIYRSRRVKIDGKKMYSGRTHRNIEKVPKKKKKELM